MEDKVIKVIAFEYLHFLLQTTIELMLMFSGQGADTKYYPEKNGVREEYIVW